MNLVPPRAGPAGPKCRWDTTLIALVSGGRTDAPHGPIGAIGRKADERNKSDDPDLRRGARWAYHIARTWRGQAQPYRADLTRTAAADAGRWGLPGLLRLRLGVAR